MTPEQIALLRTELQDSKYQDKTPREIARMFSARPPVANPGPQPQIPRPLSATDAAKLDLTNLGEEMTAQLHRIIQDGDNGALVDWALLAEKTGLIGANLSGAIQSYAKGTVPDPNWPAEVPGDSILMSLGIRELEWHGMTFTDSIPRGAIEEIQNG